MCYEHWILKYLSECCLCETLQREREYLINLLLSLTGKMNTYNASHCVSQPIKSIRTFCIKHVEFSHSALKQLSKVFYRTDVVFPFQG